MRGPVLVLLAVAVAVSLGPRPVAADDAAEFFEENCAACHTIGGGPQGGPDLLGVTSRRDRDWLIRFLLDPDAFASDPEVARMIQEADGLAMPPIEGLKRKMAEKLLALIDERSRTAQRATPAAPRPAPAEPPVTGADVARGRELFAGTSRLSASGPACIACHESGDVSAPGGGRLGPDLTRVHQRLGGRRGLVAWLGATPTPMMRAVYRHAPLTTDEARALTAFLESGAAPGPARSSRLAPFVLTGVGGAVAVLVLVGVMGARRLRAVRRPLVASMRGPGRAVPRNAPGAAAARTPRRGATGPSDPGGSR